jgi:hypothetical protein
MSGAAPTGRDVIPEHVGKQPSVTGRDDAGRVAQPLGPGNPLDSARRFDGAIRQGRLRHVHRAHVLLGNEHIGRRVTHIGVHLAHGPGEDPVEYQHEHQRCAHTEHGQQGTAPVLEKVLASERNAAGHHPPR